MNIFDSTEGEMHIDRDHDVPLLAAALDDGNGFYGAAVDRRIPHWFTNEGVTYDPSQFVHEHERIEHADMEQNGTKYQDAHDKVATPYESHLVKKFAEEKGADPDKFFKNHQNFWTKHLEQANASPPEKVHPHTYMKPYEDSNHQFTEEMKKNMTHEAEAPNPAKPYVDAIKAFAQGGLHGALKQAGIETPEWFDKSVEFMNRQDVQTALGMATPLGKAELIASPASRYAKKKVGGTPEIITGSNHWEDIVHKASKKGFNPYEDLVEDGFVTNTGRFVGRSEAFDITKKTLGEEHLTESARKHGKLVSEDMTPGHRWVRKEIENKSPSALKPGNRRVPLGRLPEEIDAMHVDDYIKLMNYSAEPPP